MPDMWSGIPSPLEDKPCGVCGSNENVKHTMVEVRQGGCVKSFFSHVQANLCSECCKNGWVIFDKADPDGTVSYYNLGNQEFKYSK